LLLSHTPEKVTQDTNQGMGGMQAEAVEKWEDL